MKYFVTAVISLAFCSAVFAQSGTTSVSYNKMQQPALMLSLPYKESVAEGTILDKLKETGYNPETKGKFFWKQNKVNGFFTFKGVVLEGSSAQMVDLYFKVDPQGKDRSIIYMLMAKGDEHFLTPDSDVDAYNAGKKFLDGFVANTAAYKLNLDVQAQQTSVSNAEKKMNKLKDDERDMLKKIEQLQDNLKNNRAQQDNQIKVIEAERRKLEDLKAKAI